MSINPQIIFQMLQMGNNPQQIVAQFSQQIFQSNPMMANLFQLAQQGNGAQIEKIARNICASSGKDFDKEFNAFRQMLGR